MALHIEDPEVERLARELGERRGVSVEDALREALTAERARTRERYDEIMGFLRSSSIVPGGPPIGKEEEAAILGYDEDGLCPS